MRSEHLPLFGIEQAKNRTVYRLFSSSIFVCISATWVYRMIYVPERGDSMRWTWILLFAAELWFALFWVLSQSFRWNRVRRYTFKDRLSHRFEDKLPGVDIFVCTADPTIEPPLMVINTVLSIMAYDYPPEKLSVYLSDDGGSVLTFYALLEASHFSKHWLPFCKKFNIEPRSPAAYFANISDSISQSTEFQSIKKLYDEMEHRIETATKFGRVSDEIRAQHKGFSEWDSVSSPRDHQTIVQILVDGRDPRVLDTEGSPLPTLAYLSREKRPNHHHNFKAGSMNALIRVSGNISNGSIILNVDCDMYSNNSKSVRDALCFLMDEEKGHEIAYVQYPQCFNNVTKNDIYGSSMRIIREVDFPGLDGIGGPAYVGTGCFHRRETLCGNKYVEGRKFEWKRGFVRREGTVSELEETSKSLADCSYEKGTQWGNEMGLLYGCPVEDVITGLSIQCRGWKSAFFRPERIGFLGVPPNTLADALVQHKRWSEGDFQILLSKYGPLTYGIGRINVALQMGYCVYTLWAPTSLATLYFLIVPPLCLLKGIPLFPKVSSLWFLPFVYVIVAENMYSLFEFLWSGGTLQGWWNEQRMWMFKRESSYLFGFIDTVFKLLGLSNSAFDISSKVVDPDVSQRYEKEIIEFGRSTPMFTIIATLAMLNLFSLVGGLKRVVTDVEGSAFESFFLQLLLSSVAVLINHPVYQGLFFRKDKGRMPASLSFKSTVLALLICLISLY
ncbi:hypothetical protein Scep_028997 [Stephania cephalantha]|uniref:Cellulose synthase-like protein E1 n=1 Tax=Stephania cephalantha TaxID=152367 RepID=A0AAP0ED30_9MAGN